MGRGLEGGREAVQGAVVGQREGERRSGGMVGDVRRGGLGLGWSTASAVRTRKKRENVSNDVCVGQCFSHDVTEGGLELTIPMHPLPQPWNHSCVCTTTSDLYHAGNGTQEFMPTRQAFYQMRCIPSFTFQERRKDGGREGGKEGIREERRE